MPKDRKVNSFSFEVLCFVTMVRIEPRVLSMLSKCSASEQDKNAWLLFVCLFVYKLEKWESSVTLDPDNTVLVLCQYLSY